MTKYSFLLYTSLLLIAACSFKLKPATNPFYQTVMQIDPANEAALYGQGELLVRQGHFQEALPYFERLVRVAPAQAHGWSRLGRCRLELRQFRGAKAALGQALQRQPTLESYLGLATADAMLGNQSQARQLADKIEKDYGVSAESLRLRGDIEFLAKNWTKALEFYKKSKDRDPGRAELNNRIRDLEEFLTIPR